MSKVFSVVVILLGVLFWYLLKPPTYNFGKYRRDDFWGTEEFSPDGPLPKDDKAIKTFKIEITANTIADIKGRISRTKFPVPIVKSQEYGATVHSIKPILQYWQNEFKWDKQQEILNRYNHHHTEIEGLDIHFIRYRKEHPPAVKVYPLILVHGWPSTFYEFYNIIEPLTQEKNGFAFEVIVPSLPGFAWSEGPYRPGMNIFHMARVFAKLMTRNGFDKFYYHGSDWGMMIGRALSVLYPSRILGLHLVNPLGKGDVSVIAKYALGLALPSLVYDDPVRDYAKVEPKKMIHLIEMELAHLLVMSTKPDTLGMALSDAPAGLVALMFEKFSTWTNITNVQQLTGGLDSKERFPFSKDDFLTHVMILWSTRTVTSSLRIAKENYDRMITMHMPAVPSQVPVGIASFPNDLISLPRALLASAYENIQQFTYMPCGGHFPAMEEPELLVADIREFVHKTIYFPQK